MRKPETIEKLYLDFDGFFASVMQQAMPELRGRPVGVIPFETSAASSTVVIACSREAKAAGCKNVMPVPEALKICPDLVLVTQRPDLFRRAHNALLNEIYCEIPIETVKSIDELTCKLDPSGIANPVALTARIKSRIRQNIGAQITCSIGFAANRLLAKIACKVDKPDGVTIWRPEQMPEPLFVLPLSDIPGVGKRMELRLNEAAITTTRDLWHSQPKQLRALWGNVNGERMWYALHGYDLHARPTSRGMFGHGRVLPPRWRDFEHAQSCSRLLLTKAARRMRRGGYYAGRLGLWLDNRGGDWFGQREMPCVQDDQACLGALSILWRKAQSQLPPRTQIIRVGVTLLGLSPSNRRQLDLLLNDDAERQKCELLTNTIDGLNRKFGKRVVTIGPWTPPARRLCRGQDRLQPDSLGGGFLVNWRSDTSLRDLDDSVVLESTCMRCLHVWLQSPVQLLIKVDHRNVRLDEVAKHLACPRSGCRHVGVRLALIKNEDTSGFVGGMP